MNSLEELETIVIHRTAGLPDLFIDLDDSAGDDVDLSTGYGSFVSTFIDEDRGEHALGTCTGTATGFRVVLPAGGLELNADQYVLRCEATRTSDSRKRLAYANVQLLTY